MRMELDKCALSQSPVIILRPTEIVSTIYQWSSAFGVPHLTVRTAPPCQS